MKIKLDEKKDNCKIEYIPDKININSIIINIDKFDILFKDNKIFLNIGENHIYSILFNDIEKLKILKDNI